MPSIYDVSDNPFRINYTTDINEESTLNQSYSVSQNYPNPFNPTTRIFYTIPEYAFVRIEVYDVLGKLISTIVSSQQIPGNYIEDFDGASIPSGIYYYKLSTISYVDCKKIILLK